MPTNSADAACPECGRSEGHRMSCVTGNEIAGRYQKKLERRYAIKELEEIRNCDKCDLCEDHHA
jgi:hypothetical protein